MKLLLDLFSTDYGLLSLGVIVLTMLMSAFFTRYFFKHMEDNA